MKRLLKMIRQPKLNRQRAEAIRLEVEAYQKSKV